jgi:hypothetical protein
VMRINSDIGSMRAKVSRRNDMPDVAVGRNGGFPEAVALRPSNSPNLLRTWMRVEFPIPSPKMRKRLKHQPA